MNYWLGLGIAVLLVGILFFVLGRGASRRIARDGFETGNAGAVVILGYGLPTLGLLFILIGVLQAV